MGPWEVITMRRFVAPSIALVALLMIVAPVAAASWTAPADITATHDAFPSYARSLAVVGDRVHLVDSRLNGQIEYRRSLDDGAHWSAPAINSFSITAAAISRARMQSRSTTPNSL